MKGTGGTGGFGGIVPGAGPETVGLGGIMGLCGVMGLPAIEAESMPPIAIFFTLPPAR